MRDGWKSFLVGDVVRQVRRRVHVSEMRQFPLLGVRWYGAGPFHRETVTNKTSKATQLFRVHEGDFIYNRLFAWKGSFGIVSADLDGYFVSGEFPVFETDPTLLLPQYLNLVMCRPEVWVQVDRESTGSTTISRNRWKEERFLQYHLALPPIQEQRRIIDLLGAIDCEARQAATLAQDADRERTAFEESKLPITRRGATVPLGDIAEVVSGVTKDAKRQADPSFVEVPYIRVANVQRGHLDLDDVATIRVPERRALQLRLRTGDILFNEGGDRDKLGRGWVWEGQIDRCIHQNHVLRARLRDEAFDPRFVSIWGNTYGRHWFEAMGSQTTNLASLNLSTLKRFPVPVLPVAEQRLLVESSEAFRSLARQAASVAEAAKDVRLAVLAELLSGNHEIPDAYDVLLEPAS